MGFWELRAHLADGARTACRPHVPRITLAVTRTPRDAPRSVGPRRARGAWRVGGALFVEPEPALCAEGVLRRVRITRVPAVQGLGFSFGKVIRGLSPGHGVRAQ